jgi:HMG (high mobility group) box
MRYQVEKAQYKGPWKIDSKEIIPPKKPAAPFLAYMRLVRADVRHDHPDASTTDICRLVASKWNSSPAAQKEFKDKYKGDWKQYKEDLLEWHTKQGVAHGVKDAGKKAQPQAKSAISLSPKPEQGLLSLLPPRSEQSSNANQDLASHVAATKAECMPLSNLTWPSAALKDLHDQQGSWVNQVKSSAWHSCEHPRQNTYMAASTLMSVSCDHAGDNHRLLLHNLLQQVLLAKEEPVGDHDAEKFSRLFSDEALWQHLPHMNDCSPIDDAFSWT